MKTMVFAAVAALTLGAAPAFAGDSGDMPAATRFTMIADAQAHPATVQPSPSTHHFDGATRVNPVQARDLGTWLFAPAQGGGDQ